MSPLYISSKVNRLNWVSARLRVKMEELKERDWGS